MRVIRWIKVLVLLECLNRWIRMPNRKILLRTQFIHICGCVGRDCSGSSVKVSCRNTCAFASCQTVLNWSTIQLPHLKFYRFKFLLYNSPFLSKLFQIYRENGSITIILDDLNDWNSSLLAFKGWQSRTCIFSCFKCWMRFCGNRGGNTL